MQLHVCRGCLKRIHLIQDTLSELTFLPLACLGSFQTLASQRSVSTAVAAGVSAKPKKQQPAEQGTKLKQQTHRQYPFLPLRLVRGSQVYMLDNASADQIVKAVRKHQSHPELPVVEGNPGPGIVTEKLIKAGVKKVVCVESTEEFLPHLEKLQKKVGEKVLSVHSWKYVASSLPEWNPSVMSDDPADSLALLTPQERRTEGPAFTVLNTLPYQRQGSFFKCILNNLVSQQGLSSCGQPEWFLIVSSSMYKSLLIAEMDKDRPNKKFSNIAVVLLLLFHVQKCAEVPGSLFTPSFPEKKKGGKIRARRPEKPEIPDDLRFLIHFKPRSDPLLTPAEIPAFSSFLKQVLHFKRNDRLLPKMEQLIPGCGVRLIILGVLAMDKVGDLPAKMYRDIFREMQTWPEFEGSPMKQHLSDTIMLPHEEEPDDDKSDDS